MNLSDEFNTRKYTKPNGFYCYDSMKSDSTSHIVSFNNRILYFAYNVFIFTLPT